jgi:hypothetical protein
VKWLSFEGVAVLNSQALEWIAAMTGLTKKADESVNQFLKNGVVLCKLMNRLQPESIKKINESSMAFKQMENIGNFLDAAQVKRLQTENVILRTPTLGIPTSISIESPPTQTELGSISESPKGHSGILAMCT